MKPLYFAPLEGIGNHIYRSTFCRHCSGVDRFYTPFIDINSDGGMKKRGVNDILPENNPGIQLIPQLLTKNPAALGRATGFFRELGYEETNLNLGCPSPTVTKKGKGSGMLEDPAALAVFFEEAFSCTETALSVKMRIGIDREEEWEPLMEVLNRFPLRELTVHPRLQKEYYRGAVHEDIFRKIYETAAFPVCVNPGVTCREEFLYWQEKYPGLSGIMIGRPLVSNPFLAEQIKDIRSPADDRDRFFLFHDDLLDSYRKVLSGDTPVLFKMKELWDFWDKSFSVEPQLRKKITKARTVPEYEGLIRQLKKEEGPEKPACFRKCFT